MPANTGDRMPFLLTTGAALQLADQFLDTVWPAHMAELHLHPIGA